MAMPPHKGVIGRHFIWFGGWVELAASYWYTTHLLEQVLGNKSTFMVAQEMCMSLLGLTHDLRFFYTPYHLLLSYKYNV
jgi:hypothetical protein